jgi:hypothetical protein
LSLRAFVLGVRLTALFDSCHSGTALDLPCVYGPDGQLKQKSELKALGQTAMGAGLSFLTGNPIGGISRLLSGTRGIGRRGKPEEKYSHADVIMFAGCKDAQTSADAHIEGRSSLLLKRHFYQCCLLGEFTGAMSHAFIKALRHQPQQTYQELLINCRNILAREYSQVPQMSSSRPMQMHYPFLM